MTGIEATDTQLIIHGLCRIDGPGFHLYPKMPLAAAFDIERITDEDGAQFLSIQCERWGINIAADTLDELVDDFKEEVISAWRFFVQELDENLSDPALLIKRSLLLYWSEYPSSLIDPICRSTSEKRIEDDATMVKVKLVSASLTKGSDEEYHLIKRLVAVLRQAEHALVTQDGLMAYDGDPAQAFPLAAGNRAILELIERTKQVFGLTP